MEQTRKAPEQVMLYSRDGKNNLDLTQQRVYLGTGGAAIKILDLETGEARLPTLKDLYQLARLVDVLDNIHFFLRPCIPTDISETAYDENSLFACLKGTAKHVMFGVTDEQGFQKVFDIASMVAGGAEKLKEKPFFSTVACFAISPLKLCTQSTLNMQAAVRHQIPVALSSLFCHQSLKTLHSVDVEHASGSAPSNPGGPFQRPHGRIDRANDNGRHIGPAPCRRDVRNYHMSVNLPGSTGPLRRYPRNGQFAGFGVSGRRR
jgi:hypothetical protein